MGNGPEGLIGQGTRRRRRRKKRRRRRDTKLHLLYKRERRDISMYRMD
jgi:hypothetical protein